MTAITTLSRICENLEKYVFDRVWNDPYSEYRTYTRPQMLNTVPVGGHFDGRYSTILLPDDRSFSLTKDITFLSNKTYYKLSSVGTYVPAEVTVGETIPSRSYYELDDDTYSTWMSKYRAKYYVLTVPAAMFGPVRMNVPTWIPLSDYCNKNFPDLQLFTKSGIFLNKGSILIRQSDMKDCMLFAVEADMYEKIIGELGRVLVYDTVVSPEKNYYVRFVDSGHKIHWTNAVYTDKVGKQIITEFKDGLKYYHYVSSKNIYGLLAVTTKEEFDEARSKYATIYTDSTVVRNTRVVDESQFDVIDTGVYAFKTLPEDMGYYEDDEIFFGKYHDSDGVADNTINAFCVNTNVANVFKKTNAVTDYGLKSATYNLCNGKLITGNFDDYHTKIKAGDYIESVVDKDVVGTFTVPCYDSVKYVLDTSRVWHSDASYYFIKDRHAKTIEYVEIEINFESEYFAAIDEHGALYIKKEECAQTYMDGSNKKLLVHIPREFNPNHYLITPQTCDVWLVPKKLRKWNDEDPNEVVPEPMLSGIYIYPCGKGDMFSQISHNDFSIRMDYLERLANENLVVEGEFEIKVFVRCHNKRKVFVRDFNYIDILYSLDDKTIVEFLRGIHEAQTNPTDKSLLFWQASELEKSRYADALIRRRNTVDHKGTIDPVDGTYINLQCEKCQLRDRCSILPEPLLDYIEGCTTYYYKAVDDTWTWATGITDAEMFRNLNDLHGPLYNDAAITAVCPHFSERSLRHYVQILGYFHVLSLIGNRVTHFRITKEGSRSVVVNAPLAFAGSDMNAMDFYPIVYHNGYRVDQSRISWGESASAPDGVKEIYHSSDELMGTGIIRSNFAAKLRVSIEPTYFESNDLIFYHDKNYYIDKGGEKILWHGCTKSAYERLVDQYGNPLDSRLNYDFIYGEPITAKMMTLSEEDDVFQRDTQYWAVPYEEVEDAKVVTQDTVFTADKVYFEKILDEDNNVVTRTLNGGTLGEYRSGTNQVKYVFPYCALTDDTVFESDKIYFTKTKVFKKDAVYYRKVRYATMVATGEIRKYNALDKEEGNLEPIEVPKIHQTPGTAERIAGHIHDSKEFAWALEEYGTIYISKTIHCTNRIAPPIPKGTYYDCRCMMISEFNGDVYENYTGPICGSHIELIEGLDYNVGDKIKDYEIANIDKNYRVGIPNGLKIYNADESYLVNDTICVELLDDRKAGMIRPIDYPASSTDDVYIDVATPDQWQLYKVTYQRIDPNDPSTTKMYTPIPREEAGEYSEITKQLHLSYDLRGVSMLLVESPLVLESYKKEVITEDKVGYLGGRLDKWIPVNAGTDARVNTDFPLDSEIVFLNNRRLIRGLDYATDGYDESSQFGANVYCQNFSYLARDNKLDCIRTNTDLISDMRGYMTGNVITWSGQDPFWFSELSTLVIGGRMCSYFKHTLGEIKVSDMARDGQGVLQYRNGDPFEVRTSISTRVREVLDCDDLMTEDIRKIREITEFFAVPKETASYETIIPHSHKIYSIFVEAIIGEYLTGSFNFYLKNELKPDGSVPVTTDAEFEAQFKKFMYLKSRDVIYDPGFTEYDLKFVDVYPHYHRITAKNREAYAKLHALYNYFLPNDNIKHKDAPHE